eukprot:TRINITY_DN33108_c0_g1_i1.p2 TRINITY_DN33108_c0_g1~~TRINITY_DN33108_c0_g1_i1.p2  ORF type:complete len:225 (+),score=83.05 TRINITY_DN33108_c0_g1_i1:93-767(+)
MATRDVDRRATVGRFLQRWVDAVREGHTVFGFLPGFYDGWLLDSEGVIRDPFTRSERVVALGLRVSVSLLVSYVGDVVVQSEWNKTLKEWTRDNILSLTACVWDSVVVAGLDASINLLVGSAKCKQILQNDWDREDSESPEAVERRQKANRAKVWAGFVSVAGALFFALTAHTERTAKVLGEFHKSFAIDALIVEPLTMMAQLAASLFLGRPISGISYLPHVRS